MFVARRAQRRRRDRRNGERVPHSIGGSAKMGRRTSDQQTASKMGPGIGPALKPAVAE